jgi:hypothetical protein
MITTLGIRGRGGIDAKLDSHSDPPMILISYLSRRRSLIVWSTFTA